MRQVCGIDRYQIAGGRDQDLQREREHSPPVHQEENGKDGKEGTERTKWQPKRRTVSLHFSE